MSVTLVLVLSLLLATPPGDQATVCKSEQCQQISRSMYQYIDHSQDRCHDFYLYACKKFKDLKINNIESHADMSRISAKSSLRKTFTDLTFLESNVSLAIKALGEAIKNSPSKAWPDLLNVLKEHRIAVARLVYNSTLSQNNSKLLVASQVFNATFKAVIDVHSNVLDIDQLEKNVTRWMEKSFRVIFGLPDMFLNDGLLDLILNLKTIQDPDDLRVLPPLMPTIDANLMRDIDATGPQIIIAFTSPGMYVSPLTLDEPILYTEVPLHLNLADFGMRIARSLVEIKLVHLRKEEKLNNWFERYLDYLKCVSRQVSDIKEPVTKTMIHRDYLPAAGFPLSLDITSLSVTLGAFDEAIKSNNETLPRNEKKFTPLETFFIRTTQCYCNNLDKSKIEAQMRLQNDAIPDYFRAIVPLMNNERFAKTFNCPKGSRMNPKDKCVLW